MTTDDRIKQIEANLAELKRKQTPITPFEWEKINAIKAENEQLKNRIIDLEQMLNDRTPVYAHVSTSPKSKSYKKQKSAEAYERFKTKVLSYLQANDKTHAKSVAWNDSQRRYLRKMELEGLIYWHSHKVGWRRK